MVDQITLAEVSKYFDNEDRRSVNEAKKVIAFEGDTVVSLDKIIHDVFVNLDTMPVTLCQLTNVENVAIGQSTKFSIFNIKRIV